MKFTFEFLTEKDFTHELEIDHDLIFTRMHSHYAVMLFDKLDKVHKNQRERAIRIYRKVWEWEDRYKQLKRSG